MTLLAQWLIIESSNHWWTAEAFFFMLGAFSAVLAGATMIWLRERLMGAVINYYFRPLSGSTPKSAQGK